MNKLSAMAAFVQIIEKGSLTAAAQALDTSLPSVVRTLAALEQELGVRLLNRTTRRIRLTDEGSQYLERCRAILSAVQEAEAALTSRRTEPQGRLAVTASVLFGRRYVAPIVSEFLRRHPSVSVELTFVDRVVSMVDEGIDVAIRIGHLADSSLIAIPVGRVRRVVCASPDYLHRRGVPRVPDDIRMHSCVRHTGPALRDFHFRNGRRTVTIPMHAAISCNDIDSSLAACLDDHGLGVFLSYQTASYRKQKKLRYVLEQYEMEPIPVHVVYQQAKLVTSTVRAFVDECVTKLRKLRFE